MKDSIYNKVPQTLKQAEQHNSNIMVKPEVILWPDPERQWTEVMPVLQGVIPPLIVFGPNDRSKKQWPAIGLKFVAEETFKDPTGVKWGIMKCI